jgi:hypothetical protein
MQNVFYSLTILKGYTHDWMAYSYRDCVCCGNHFIQTAAGKERRALAMSKLWEIVWRTAGSLPALRSFYQMEKVLSIYMLTGTQRGGGMRL